MVDTKILEEKLWLEVYQLEKYFESDDDTWFFIPARFTDDEIQYLVDHPDFCPDCREYSRAIVRRQEFIDKNFN